MSSFHRRLFCSLAFISAATGSCEASVRVSAWLPIYQGVEYARGEADAGEPRLQKAYAIRVDLTAPGVAFLTTPPNGDLPLETTSETAGEFLERHHLQVAINANFYAPCCEPGEKDLRGFALSQGHTVSPPAEEGRFAAALLIARDNKAVLTPTAATVDLNGYWNGVAGSDLVLINGAIPRFPDQSFYTANHPRSLVGLSADGRYLILLVIDGRQPGHSIGAPMADAAAWLLRFGAHEGLNLDGGGSSALVCSGPDGRAVPLNRVSGAGKPKGDDRDLTVAVRVQRSNGNHLGVFARPLPK